MNWRDVQDRAVTFVYRFKDAKDEDKDAKSFWKELFALYGVDERSIGSFEERVKIHDRPGIARMDYFAPKRFLIEQKSRGKDLSVAYTQALDYFAALSEDEKPRYIIVSDFEHIHIYDLEAKGKKRHVMFRIAELPKQVKKLALLADEKDDTFETESKIDVKAVYAIGRLHKALKESNYTPEHLAPLLTRLVFCFFGDDTGIFNPNHVRTYLIENTKEDGSDLGTHLNAIFQVLNTSPDKRQTTMDEALLALPYVNGGLFAETLNVVFATRDVRDTLMKCLAFDWSEVSPEIFGSMFQSIMNEEERHDLGAHYTSEKNIMKVIGPLFLDALKEELERARSEASLRALWDKVSTITLLDPACGCGNFLVVAYRELRRVEIEIIKKLDKGKKGYVAAVEGGHVPLNFGTGNLKNLSRMSVEHMYGIELEPFAAEVAKLSLWLVDHMMNMELGAYYGQPLRKLPLTEAPHIVQGNALRLDWESVVPKSQLTHILGNPPFLGSKVMTDEQRAELKAIVGEGAGVLDYVSGWYVKAAAYIHDTSITAAFVSTNSITQGEQVGLLWKQITDKFGLHIHFAHRTFKWSNQAKGKAAVYCVVVGFGKDAPAAYRLFAYDDITADPVETRVSRINAYLTDGPDIYIESRSTPLCAVPEIGIGNKPIDGGLYLFTTQEMQEFVAKEPTSQRYFKRWIGAEEFLHGEARWCLWLGNTEPEALKAMPEVLRHIDAVRQYRLLSKSAPTRKLAETPTRFHVENMPEGSFIIFPRHSSEHRPYLPLGFAPKETLVGDSCLISNNATLYHFGVLESAMHMAWMRAVAGRLKSDYRYSKDIVYNNFPWPEAETDEQKEKVEECAQAVLDARAAHQGATLADMYDPLTMPKDLRDAHTTLDKAVDACYGKRRFTSEPSRLEFLFERYKHLTS